VLADITIKRNVRVVTEVPRQGPGAAGGPLSELGGEVELSRRHVIKSPCERKEYLGGTTVRSESRDKSAGFLGVKNAFVLDSDAHLNSCSDGLQCMGTRGVYL
jgi:hypothetical protein